MFGACSPLLQVVQRHRRVRINPTYRASHHAESQSTVGPLLDDGISPLEDRGLDCGNTVPTADEMVHVARDC
jgi:hypothetical protein